MALFVTLSVLLAVALGYLVTRLRALRELHSAAERELETIRTRFAPIVDLEAERARIQEENNQIRLELERAIERLSEQREKEKGEVAELLERITGLRGDLAALEREVDLHDYGFYSARYGFDSSERYQQRLDEIRERQKQMLKEEAAAVSTVRWTVNGSEAEGKKQIKQLLKLILRAFNGESDAAIAKVKFNNVASMESRIRKAAETISSLAKTQGCEITKAYLDLKLEELYLVYEYQEKVQEEKEEQKRIKEQMREEERAQREIEKAQQDAEREERLYQDALMKAREDAQRAVGAQQDQLMQQIEALQRKLDEAKENKERALSRAQMTRSGHVYIISNIGSFGEHVYKIGMTRRLDPLDRVRELSDASVPFDFDVHAVIYADDAPALEATLHRTFGNRRVNRVNERKEFFRVSIDEIGDAVRSHHGEIELTKIAEARDYRRTLTMIAEHERSADSTETRVVTGIG